MPNIEVTLSTRTCNCGAVYAVPHWATPVDYICPFCARRQLEQERNRMHYYRDQCDHKDRQISSLRGAITRMKRKH